MVPEYVDTKVKVATKSINSLKQETRFLPKTRGLKRLVPISICGVRANPMYAGNTDPEISMTLKCNIYAYTFSLCT